MKTWNIKISYPDRGEIRETTIQAEDKESATKKFFARKEKTSMLLEGTLNIEVTEVIDTLPAEDYTREILIQLCEDGSVPQSHWYDRDSERAQRQLGEALMLLKAGCDWKVEEISQQCVRIEVFNIEGFQYHEIGEEGYNSDTFYIPTRDTLDRAEGKDWY